MNGKFIFENKQKIVKNLEGLLKIMKIESNENDNANLIKSSNLEIE